MNCLECEAPISGRSDKKFCDDFCRNAYNNRRNKDASNLMRQIHTQLRKNYGILKRMALENENQMTTSLKLSAEGFVFDYFTGYKISWEGREIRMLYDLGYEFLENSYLRIHLPADTTEIKVKTE